MNKKNINILVDEGFNNDYLNFLNMRYNVKEIIKFKDVLEKRCTIQFDLIVFTGGEDVDPAIYGEKIGKFTTINKNRDKVACDIFHNYNYVPKLGICRGSQFLCAMSGGRIIQHVTGHTSSHTCEFMVSKNDISEFMITSTHHQMMYPFRINKDKYKILAWSKVFLSNTYLNGDDKDIELDTKFLEPEIVYFNNTNSLSIQGHPEFKDVSSFTLNTIFNMIDRNLFNKK